MGLGGNYVSYIAPNCAACLAKQTYYTEICLKPDCTLWFINMMTALHWTPIVYLEPGISLG